MFGLIGVIVIGGLTGFLAEYFNFTRNGQVVSVVIGIGGAVALWVVLGILGLSFGLGRGAISVIGAGGLLFLADRRRR